MDILIIEDEPKLGKALCEGLKTEGYDVTLTRSGEDGFFKANERFFDLILLDVMLPGRNGIDVLKTLRKQQVQTPVLIITARDALEDRVLGLDAGADDYLIKPFAFLELSARIRALFRRGKPESVVVLRSNTLEMNLITREVSREGKRIDLTMREFEILEYLLRNAGHVVLRAMLARDVWRETSRAIHLDNIIDVHIARLRRKMDDQFDHKLIRTVRGVGFMLSGE
jgi:two-component system, OmpR family, copper resistance phosphate regulon response regulator CusR